MDHRWLTLCLTTKPHPWACPSWACHPGVGAVGASGSLQQWSRGAGARGLVSVLCSVSSLRTEASTVALVTGSHNSGKPLFRHLDHSPSAAAAARLHKQSA